MQHVNAPKHIWARRLRAGDTAPNPLPWALSLVPMTSREEVEEATYVRTDLVAPMIRAALDRYETMIQDRVSFYDSLRDMSADREDQDYYDNLGAVLWCMLRDLRASRK